MAGTLDMELAMRPGAGMGGNCNRIFVGIARSRWRFCCRAGFKKGNQRAHTTDSGGIIGSDRAHSGCGCVSAVLLGSMNWTIALPFAAGALTGALARRLLAHYLAGPKLQQGSAVVSMGVSVWMIVRLFWVA